MNFKELEQIFESGTREELEQFTNKYNLVIKDGKIYADDTIDIDMQIAFWDKRQLVKKINLNS